jgi:aspartokinase/homoserine dehydrogenase 1
MKVLKFGGSSLATSECVRKVAAIVLDAADSGPIVVVSAFQGVTDALIDAARTAANGKSEYEALCGEIGERHRRAVLELVTGSGQKALLAEIESRLVELRDTLHGIFLLHDCPDRALDFVGSQGEMFAASILAAHLQERHSASFIDARDLIVTNDQFTHAAVRFDKTNPRIQKVFKKLFAADPKTIPVVTGFIAATEDGRTTTVGRNGSDYSAAIIGAAMNVAEIEIWTDVDGVYSADPRAVPSAFVLEQMTYEEAMELSYFGAKVLHSATIAPAVAGAIPIRIRNTFNPSAPGTLIGAPPEQWDGVVKGIIAVNNITLLTLRGLQMVGVPGIAERLFRGLASQRVNVILISQASSEHTICFSVLEQDVAAARRAVEQEFPYELQNGLTALDEKPHQAIVAVVGEGMRGTPGVSGKVFQALGQNAINITAIAQGASERNISFVIDASQKTHALNVIHQAFFEKVRKLALAVVGVGNVGSAVLRQVAQQQKVLLDQGFEVRVCAVANSRRMVIRPEGIDLDKWEQKLLQSDRTSNMSELANEIGSFQPIHAALIDCTANAGVVEAYPKFIQANMHIVTPNKRANVLPWKQYRDLMALLQKKCKHFLYEANVGAGLPIISTLKDLVASGDTILRIEGIFSGTLSYLFNQYDGSVPFSALVQEAQKLGYTEPDPRDDLSGQDVARKLLILARQLGRQCDLEDIPNENLVPVDLRGGGFDPGFYGKFAAHDQEILKRFRNARARGCMLRYVGTLDSAGASAGLREFPQDHPFTSTRESDNIISFTTQRYSRSPLVVQGPGAGADVTAMGVFSDIYKLLHYLPY